MMIIAEPPLALRPWGMRSIGTEKWIKLGDRFPGRSAGAGKVVHQTQIDLDEGIFTSITRKYSYFLALIHFSVPILLIPRF